MANDDNNTITVDDVCDAVLIIKNTTNKQTNKFKIFCTKFSLPLSLFFHHISAVALDVSTSALLVTSAPPPEDAAADVDVDDDEGDDDG